MRFSKLLGEPSPGLLRIITSYAFSMLTFWMLVPLTSFILAERNVNVAIIGIFGSVPWLAIFAFLPFSSLLICTFGAARIYRWGIYSSIVATIGFTLADSLAVWFVCNLFVGLSVSLRWNIVSSWVVAEAPSEFRGRVIGFYETLASAMIGVGPLILYFTGTKSALPFVVAVASSGTALLLIMGIRNPQSLDIKRVNQKGLLRPIRQQPSVFLMALLGGLVESGAIPILPEYGVSLGLQPSEASLFVAAVGIGNVLIQYPLGYLVDRIHYYQLVITCGGASLILLLALPIASKTGILFGILASLWGSILGSFYTLATARAGAVYTEGNLVQALTVMAMTYTLGSFVGPILGGSALAIWRPHGFTIMYSALTLGGLMAITALRKRKVSQCGSVKTKTR